MLFINYSICSQQSKCQTALAESPLRLLLAGFKNANNTASVIFFLTTTARGKSQCKLFPGKEREMRKTWQPGAGEVWGVRSRPKAQRRGSKPEPWGLRSRPKTGIVWEQHPTSASPGLPVPALHPAVGRRQQRQAVVAFSLSFEASPCPFSLHASLPQAWICRAGSFETFRGVGKARAAAEQ